MLTIRRAEDRGHADHGWLNAHHTFSFAGYHDPEFMGFRALRVINDDTVAGGEGFGMHPHRDMEIITYILSGALEHKDSMGHGAVMRAGDVQRISAGSGISHSEFNHSPGEAVHLLQIWIMPDVKGAKPAYSEKSFKDAPTGRLNLIASKAGRDHSIIINQDADVYLAKLSSGQSVEHTLKSTRAAWVHVAEGSVNINGRELKAGDAAAVTDETEIKVSAQAAAQILLFDLN